MGPGTIAVLASALFGSGIAALADLLQKGNAGAVSQIQTTFADVLDLAMPGWLPVLGLMILGAALCFVFQPTTRQAGFAIGLSVISVVMTATPVKLPPTPAATVTGPGTAIEPSRSRFAALDGAAPLRPLLMAQAQPQSPPAAVLKLNFEVRATGAEAKPMGEVTIKVRELPGGKVWQWRNDQFKRQSGFPLRFSYDITLGAATKSLEVRLESENYKSATSQTAVAQGAQQIDLSFALEPSSVPGFIQRLIEPKRF